MGEYTRIHQYEPLSYVTTPAERIRRAAPKLLEACEALATAWDGRDWSHWGVSSALYDAVEQVRAAIKEARGE